MTHATRSRLLSILLAFGVLLPSEAGAVWAGGGGREVRRVDTAASTRESPAPSGFLSRWRARRGADRAYRSLMEREGEMLSANVDTRGRERDLKSAKSRRRWARTWGFVNDIGVALGAMGMISNAATGNYLFAAINFFLMDANARQAGKRSAAARVESRKIRQLTWSIQRDHVAEAARQNRLTKRETSAFRRVGLLPN